MLRILSRFAIGPLALALIPLYSQAEEILNPYSFGVGSCQSQGLWTADATAALNQIRSIALKLQDDPNCGALRKTLDEFYASFSENGGLPPGADKVANGLSSFRSEIESLISYARGGRYLQEEVREAMVNKTIDAAIMQAESKSSWGRQTVDSIAGDLVSLQERVQRTVSFGMDILERATSAALTESECLQNANFAGPLLGAYVQMANALAASGQDASGVRISRIGSTISKLFQFVIDKKYTDTKNQLNRAQFRNSMSCLLETVSESYCSTLDAEILYQEHVRQNGYQRDPRSGMLTKKSVLGTQLDTPLRGFFILTQLVPIATGWVEKVQRGVEPRNSADSQFKNDILRNTITYYIQENELFAAANADQVTIRKLPDIEGKRRQVLKTVLKLTGLITGGRDDLAGLNFYTMTALPMEIPFRLIGVKVPEKVAGSTDSGFQQQPSEWLQANMQNMPEFNDPEALLAKVLTNLRTLVEEAQRNAIAYYNEWFIYDQAAQYIDSVTGFTYNVREALQHINNYLRDLSQRITQIPEMDASVLAALEDTQKRISTVLAKYEELRLLGEEFKATPAENKEAREALIEKGVETHRKLLETTYDQFMILRARSGFLLNRMAGIVRFDLQNLIRLAPDEMNRIARDIFFATGEAAFERMRAMSGSNPYMIYADIKVAQMTHLENLDAIETLLRDNFAVSTAWTRMVARNERPDTWSVSRDALRRLFEDFNEYYPAASLWDPPVAERGYFSIVGAVFSPLRYLMLPYYGFKHLERYPILGQNSYLDFVLDRRGKAPYDAYAATTVATPDIIFPDEGAAQRMLAHYCAQSLAFKDYVPFINTCRRVVLHSPFLHHQLTPEQKEEYQAASDLMKAKLRHKYLKEASKAFLENELSVDYEKKFHQYITPEVRAALHSDDEILKNEAVKMMARNQSARICALREFARNNYVHYLTQGLKTK